MTDARACMLRSCSCPRLRPPTMYAAHALTCSWHCTWDPELLITSTWRWATNFHCRFTGHGRGRGALAERPTSRPPCPGCTEMHGACLTRSSPIWIPAGSGAPIRGEDQVGGICQYHQPTAVHWVGSVCALWSFWLLRTRRAADILNYAKNADLFCGTPCSGQLQQLPQVCKHF